ncbi:MAG: DUF484 family protein [Caulobacteraceae bacterium]
MSDVSVARNRDAGPDWDAVRLLLRENPAFLREDAELLGELGLRPDVANLIDFGPVALSRVDDARRRESSERKRLETMARANFAAQTQTHEAVIDLLGSADATDLARRLDELARLRFGLVAGVVALEGPADAPDGWRLLAPGQVDLAVGPGRRSRMGHAPTALGLFGDLAPVIGSVALARIAVRTPALQGLIAFGAADPDTFAADMGAELVTFLARVIERTAGRWPPR